jgi:hypothetical protein
MKIPALVTAVCIISRRRVRGAVTKRVNARDENEINNTGVGVNRYRCVHTPVPRYSKYGSTRVLNLVAVPLY